MDKINDSGHKQQQNMASLTNSLAQVEKGAVHILIGSESIVPDPIGRQFAKLKSESDWPQHLDMNIIGFIHEQANLHFVP